jgi:hypothetical protein
MLASRAMLITHQKLGLLMVEDPQNLVLVMTLVEEVAVLISALELILYILV